MKTAVSIPDEIFRKAERLARQLRISRSELYARALASYVSSHAASEVREALDRVYASEPSGIDAGLEALQRRALPRESW